MELSRRLAQGRLAEVLGPSYAASDREVLKSRYSDSEFKQQFGHLSSDTRTAIQSYVDGINARIDDLNEKNLPDGFRTAGFRPTHWDLLDSVAITVHFLQIFGRGGAGELRSLAVLSYLKGQKAIGSRFLDVMDDLAWQNDPSAIPTVQPNDDPLAKTHYKFPQLTRAITEHHLKQIPIPNFFELLSAIRTAERSESTRVAENLKVPFRSGSYCVVVAPKRSSNRAAMLLAGPQLGLKAPSIVHEVSMSAPGIHATGMDIPGIPGVIIGHTDQFAWSITTGAADTDDIFVYKKNPLSDEVGQPAGKVQTIPFSLKIKGQPDQIVLQRRTVDGPVVLESNTTGSIFARRSASWMHEMDTLDAWDKLWRAQNASSALKAVQQASLNFNFFVADRVGNIGWHFLGLVPKRSSLVDPRFPTPANSDSRWTGFLTPEEMPHVTNPISGVLVNWNNKPAEWWPNLDTPTWGKIFENRLITDQLNSAKFTWEQIQGIPAHIALGDETWPYFKPYLKGTELETFDGRMTNGSPQAALYRTFLDELRTALFAHVTGSFLTPEYFKLILQPSVILKALEGKTKFDYLAGREASVLVGQAVIKAKSQNRIPFRASTFKTFDADPILYSNRGTTIQLTELSKDKIRAVDVLPPGESEEGPHRNDQSALARGWQYKVMAPIIH